MLIPLPFAILAEGSAGRFIERVSAVIAGDAKGLALLERPGARVASDLKARVKSKGTPLVKGLYWTVQVPDPSAWGGLQARTLIPGPDRVDPFDLPRDPKLPALSRLHSRAWDWKVLRDVPHRRMTLWQQPAVGPARIVQVKRPDRSADAAHRLALDLPPPRAALGSPCRASWRLRPTGPLPCCYAPALRSAPACRAMLA